MNMLVLGISIATVDASVALLKMGVMFAVVSRWLHSEGLQVVLLVSHERPDHEQVARDPRHGANVTSCRKLE